MHRLISHGSYTDDAGIFHPPQQERVEMASAEVEEHLADQARSTEKIRIRRLAEAERERVRESTLAKLQAVVGLSGEELASLFGPHA